MRALWFALAILVGAAAAHAQDATGRHLLAGVRAFKAGHYEAALVELKIVERAPDAPADLAFYLGPTLYKLGRYREAIDVLVSSRAPRDGLSDFYLGEAYYQVRMYRKARAVFAGLRARGLGPVLDDAAASYVDAVDVVYRSPPVDGTIDYYVDQAREQTDAVFAGELYDEARLVEALATAPHRHAEIAAAVGGAWNAAGRARDVIDLLAGDGARSSEGTWQLARAYLKVGDVTHARPLLDTIAHDKGPHAAEAGDLLHRP